MPPRLREVRRVSARSVLPSEAHRVDANHPTPDEHPDSGAGNRTLHRAGRADLTDGAGNEVTVAAGAGSMRYMIAPWLATYVAPLG